MLLCEIDSGSTRRIDLSPLRRKFTPNLERLIKIIESFGFKIRIVGGAVRDILLGRAPRDIDLLTDALPDAVMFIMGKYDISYVTKGIPHGTIKVRFPDDEEYEITSLGYEVEDECCPQSVVIHSGQSWEGDAKRRDFTIDTLSVDLDGLLYDYVGGVRDLRNQMVQFLGSPVERLQKDPILIMRFFKLLALFIDPKFDKGLLPIIKEKMKLVKKIKPARMEKEIANIRNGPNGEKVLRLMKSLGFDDVMQEVSDKAAEKDAKPVAAKTAKKDAKAVAAKAVKEAVEPMNTNELRQLTQLALAKLPPRAQLAYQAAWSRIEQTVVEQRTKKALDYEVRHSIEHARSLFFTEILKGLPPDQCERIVLDRLTGNQITEAFKVATQMNLPQQGMKPLGRTGRSPTTTDIARVGWFSAMRSAEPATLVLTAYGWKFLRPKEKVAYGQPHMIVTPEGQVTIYKLDLDAQPEPDAPDSGDQIPTDQRNTVA